MISSSAVPGPRHPGSPPEENPAGTSPTSPNTNTGNRVPLRRWPPDLDPQTGRLRSISAEESQACLEELTRRLAEIDGEDDTPEEVYDEIMRNLDEERRRQGRPPAFENCSRAEPLCISPSTMRTRP
jgi:hypothetical protein